MTGWFWAGLITGIAANEITGWTEWLARRLARWSAYTRYADPERAKARAEELVAVIADRPGQVLKLLTAGGFAIAAIRAWIIRSAAQLAAEGFGIRLKAAGGVTVAVSSIAGTAVLSLYAALTLTGALTWQAQRSSVL
jgi:hypothetical protein